DVGRELIFDVFRFDLLKESELTITSVIDEDVDAPKCLNGLCHDRLRLRRITNIVFGTNRVLIFSEGGVEPIAIDIGHYDVVASYQCCSGDGCADAGRATSNYPVAF